MPHKRQQAMASEKKREMLSTPDVEERNKRKYDLVDPDALECPNCTEPLSSPVFQCRNGHIACSQCCLKLTEGCPSCTEDLNIRCFAIEKILESVQVSCKHALQGCKEMLKYSVREVHENLCQYGTYLCPAPDCEYESPMADIPEHVMTMHPCKSKVKLDLSTRVVKFQLNQYAIENYMCSTSFQMVQAEEALFLVQCGYEGRDFAGTFYCDYFGESNVLYNLKVKLHGGSASYIIEDLTSSLKRKGEFCGMRQLLVVSIPEGVRVREYDVELSLPGRDS